LARVTKGAPFLNPGSGVSQGQSLRSRNMRHLVYTNVTTYTADNTIIRDRIGVGGKQRVARSLVEFNVDAAGLMNAKIAIDVSIINNVCVVKVQKPAAFDVDVSDIAEQPTSRKE